MCIDRNNYIRKDAQTMIPTMGLTIPYLLVMDVIQTHQVALTGNPLIDENAAVQTYHVIKQNPDESTKIMVSEWKMRLWL